MRIIAGRFRGQKIRAPAGSATRPTTDRVREAVFSILGDLSGLSVVDCYSGSGAIGLEAISRGASRAVLIESGKAALGVIRGNAARLGVSEEISVVAASVPASRRALERLAPFDVVIADPPWPIADRSAHDVSRVVAGLLSPGARVLLGHRKGEPVEVDEKSGLRLVDRRSWGDSAISFFE